VCELHFMESDILRETSHLDYATGSQVTIPLKHPRLRHGAVPSRFPNCPGYFSTDHSQLREAPGAQRMRLDLRAGKTAVADPTEAFAADQDADKILGLKDLADQDHLTADQFEPLILGETGLEKFGPNAVPFIFPHRPLPKERKRLRDGKMETAHELNGSRELNAMATVTVKTEPQDYTERDEEPGSHLVSVKSEPQDYVEWDEEPGNHVVSVKPEPDYNEEYREPSSPVPPRTKDYTDVTSVTFHLITEPQASEENRERDIAAVAVKIEPQDPREVCAEAVSMGTGKVKAQKDAKASWKELVLKGGTVETSFCRSHYEARVCKMEGVSPIPQALDRWLGRRDDRIEGLKGYFSGDAEKFMALDFIPFRRASNVDRNH
ncbi:hypothetical protein HPB47_016875, partial [Ixodes persulcatus]